jgi:hypothetical protein
MTSLHQCLYQENALAEESAVEGLHSRLSSSSRVVVDRPPSQPLSRRTMYEGPSRDSANESHEDPQMGDGHRRGNTFERLQQQSDSKWTSGSGGITDRSPLQPLSRRGPYVQMIQQSYSRWSSGSRAICDTALSQALTGHRILGGPSSVSSLEHSVETKNQEIFETLITPLCTAGLTGTGLQRAARSA